MSGLDGIKQPGGAPSPLAEPATEGAGAAAAAKVGSHAPDAAAPKVEEHDHAATREQQHRKLASFAFGGLAMEAKLSSYKPEIKDPPLEQPARDLSGLEKGEGSQRNEAFERSQTGVERLLADNQVHATAADGGARTVTSATPTEEVVASLIRGTGDLVKARDWASIASSDVAQTPAVQGRLLRLTEGKSDEEGRAALQAELLKHPDLLAQRLGVDADDRFALREGARALAGKLQGAATQWRATDETVRSPATAEDAFRGVPDMADPKGGAAKKAVILSSLKRQDAAADPPVSRTEAEYDKAADQVVSTLTRKQNDQAFRNIAESYDRQGYDLIKDPRIMNRLATMSPGEVKARISMHIEETMHFSGEALQGMTDAIFDSFMEKVRDGVATKTLERAQGQLTDAASTLESMAADPALQERALVVVEDLLQRDPTSKEFAQGVLLAQKYGIPIEIDEDDLPALMAASDGSIDDLPNWARGGYEARLKGLAGRARSALAASKPFFSALLQGRADKLRKTAENNDPSVGRGMLGFDTAYWGKVVGMAEASRGVLSAYGSAPGSALESAAIKMPAEALSDRNTRDFWIKLVATSAIGGVGAAGAASTAFGSAVGGSLLRGVGAAMLTKALTEVPDLIVNLAKADSAVGQSLAKLTAGLGNQKDVLAAKAQITAAWVSYATNVGMAGLEKAGSGFLDHLKKSNPGLYQKLAAKDRLPALLQATTKRARAFLESHPKLAKTIFGASQMAKYGAEKVWSRVKGQGKTAFKEFVSSVAVSAGGTVGRSGVRNDQQESFAAHAARRLDAVGGEDLAEALDQGLEDAGVSEKWKTVFLRDFVREGRMTTGSPQEVRAAMRAYAAERFGKIQPRNR